MLHQPRFKLDGRETRGAADNKQHQHAGPADAFEPLCEQWLQVDDLVAAVGIEIERESLHGDLILWKDGEVFSF